MLRRVPANAVNARVLKTLYHVDKAILNIRMFGVKVGHTDILVCDVIAVVPVVAGAFIVEVFTFAPAVVKIAPCAVFFAREVVRDNVDYDLDTVLIRFGTKALQRVIIAQLVADGGILRLIQPVPSAGIVMGLQRRGLYAGKACRGNVGQLVFDVVERPVEAVQDVTVFDLARKPVVSLCRCDILIGGYRCNLFSAAVAVKPLHTMHDRIMHNARTILMALLFIVSLLFHVNQVNLKLNPFSLYMIFTLL